MSRACRSGCWTDGSRVGARDLTALVPARAFRPACFAPALSSAPVSSRVTDGARADRDLQLEEMGLCTLGDSPVSLRQCCEKRRGSAPRLNLHSDWMIAYRQGDGTAGDGPLRGPADRGLDVMVALVRTTSDGIIFLEIEA